MSTSLHPEEHRKQLWQQEEETLKIVENNCLLPDLSLDQSY